MPKITEMFAFISYEEGQEDNEGIIASLQPDGHWAPFIGADMARVESLIPIANKIREITGIKYKILKFKIVEEINPESLN